VFIRAECGAESPLTLAADEYMNLRGDAARAETESWTF
jgi:hypothetical protein